MMNEEDLYILANKEISDDKMMEGLWIKAVTLCYGDTNKAKYEYIKLRVEQLQKTPLNLNPSSSNPESLKSEKQNLYESDDLNHSDHKKIKPELLLSDSSKPNEILTFNNKEYKPIEDFAKTKGYKIDNAIKMIKEGWYEGRIENGKWYISISAYSNNNENKSKDISKYGFIWWLVQGWLSLILGSIIILVTMQQSKDMLGPYSFLLIYNIVLNILVLKMNKYAFLIGTITSLNPVLWIINGIYLKHRWHLPEVNK